MFAGIFGLLAVEPLIDPNAAGAAAAAAAAAVAGGLTVGRLVVVGLLVAAGVAVLNWNRLAAVWAESVAKNASTPQAKSRELTLNVAVATSLEDDLSRGITFLRSLHSIYEKQGMPQKELNLRFLDGVELLLPKVAPEPTLGKVMADMTAPKGGAA